MATRNGLGCMVTHSEVKILLGDCGRSRLSSRIARVQPDSLLKREGRACFRCVRGRSTGVPVGSRMAYVASGDHVDHVFGDIGGVVGDAFQVLRYQD
jgi:hypothetical protein